MKFHRTKPALRRLLLIGAVTAGALCGMACGDDDPRCCEPHAEWEYETVPPQNADKKTGTKKAAGESDQQPGRENQNAGE